MKPLAPRRRASSFLAIVEGLLWTASLALFATVAWHLVDAASFQAEARELLAQASSPSTPRAASERPGPAKAASKPSKTTRPLPEGMPFGILEIPRIDLSVVVAEGDSPEVLDHAVGRLPWSARPGEDGNLVLAGHRDTFFAPLAHVQVGDEIRLWTPDREARYRVDWTAVVEPGDVGTVEASDGPALTLVTCYPFRYVGPAPQRFVVRALPVEAPRLTG